MKRFIASLLLASMLVPSIAYGDPPAPDEVGKVVAPLLQGQPAPFPGVLFSQSAAASIITDIRSVDSKVKIEVDAAVKKAEALKDSAFNDAKISCDTEKKTKDATLENQAKKIKDLNEALRIAEANAPNKAVWFGVGAVSGVLLTVATVFIVVQATK